MADPTAQNSELSRMWQEAELYESQGLFDHAQRVMKRILDEDPENQAAKRKLVDIELSKSQGMEAPPTQADPAEDLTPRQALDLGIAYMGMNHFTEALGVFGKALRSSPAVRKDVLRNMVACLLSLKRYGDAHDLVEQLVANQTLSPQERASTIGEMSGLYIEHGLLIAAKRLLDGVAEPHRTFIHDYDKMMGVASKAEAQNDHFEVLSFDEPTDLVNQRPAGAQAVSEDQAQEEIEDTTGRQFARRPKGSIALKARISYSLEGSTWMEGHTTVLASDWATINLNRPLSVGATPMVLIHLPTAREDEPVWVLTKVVAADSFGANKSVATVKFISFPAGDKNNLETFIEMARQAPDPTMLEAPAEELETKPEADSFQDFAAVSTDLDGTIEGHALKAVEMDEGLDEPSEEPQGNRVAQHLEARDDLDFSPESDDSDVELELDDGLDDDDLTQRSALFLRFACQCGQIHTVPRATIGRKGKCTNCGLEMRVPFVTPRSDSMTDKLLGKVVGGCRVLYRLGGGGMGGVFRGHHVGLDIPVAVKVLHAHLAEKDSIFVKRFIREARSAARLQHPNIVGVMNVGYEEGFHYLVMPYLGGGSAESILNRIGRFPLDRVMNIGIAICRALTMAEENNILHRDIKPANILFTDKGEPKLADLGLAKSYLDKNDPGITQTGITCGTPLYFSPEQAKGADDLDIRSDVYSLGITLYHLLQGYPPFLGDSAYVIFQKHVHEELPPFENEAAGIPEQVYLVLKKMTAKSPADRFQSAHELVEVFIALKEHLSTPQEKPIERKSLLERLGLRKVNA